MLIFTVNPGYAPKILFRLSSVHHSSKKECKDKPLHNTLLFIISPAVLECKILLVRFKIRKFRTVFADYIAIIKFV